MKKSWIYAVCLGSITTLGHTQEDETKSFQRSAFTALSQQLQDLGNGGSQIILEVLVKESGLEESEVRNRLLSLLDRLEVERRQKTEVWKELVSMGGGGVHEEQAAKFLRELIKEARKILKKKGDFLLRVGVAKAAEKAKIVPYQGKDFLLKTLSAEAGGTAVGFKGLPEKIGVLVEGQSSYRIDRGSFEGLLRTAVDELTLKKVTDIHVPLRAVLVQELAKSQYVKWVLEGTHPQLQPDCHLLFEISRFSSGAGVPSTPAQSSTPTQPAQAQEPMPIVYITIQIILEHLASGTVVFSEQMNVSYDFALEQDEGIQSLRLLDHFYRKAAVEIRKQLDGFLGG